MKIIVASTNPVKINSTQLAFEAVFKNAPMECEGVNVLSGVSDQPMTDEETLKGAQNRAINVRNIRPEAHYWVGIEGGIHEGPLGMEAFAWVTILAANQSGQAKTSTFYLPPQITKLIHQGVELGQATDRVFSEHNSGHNGGAIGFLTKGVLGRTEYYVQAVMLALIPIINKELYI